MDVGAQNHWLIAPGAFFTPADNPQSKSGYQLIFNDEFDDSPPGPYYNPNTSLWLAQNYYHGGDTDNIRDANEEMQCYVDDINHNYANDPNTPNGQKTYSRESCSSTWNANNKCLVINAWGQTPPHTMASNYNFTSGWIETLRSFKHGFFEMRCKLPAGNSYWPAFWLFTDDPAGDHDRGHEIDIFEIITNDLRKDMTNFHYDRPSTCSQTYSNPYGVCSLPAAQQGYLHHCFPSDVVMSAHSSQSDFSQAFHTFSLEWTTNSFDFYLDNTLVRSVNNNCHVPDIISTVIANLAIAPVEWGYGAPGAGPAKMSIDYIRIYKKIDIQSFGHGSSAGGFDVSEHPRIMADVNGDGKADVVGFGGAGVYVSLAQVNSSTGLVSFTSPSLWVAQFGYDAAAGGWRAAYHPRTMADVNGDGKADVVGFAGAGVYVSLSSGTSFSTPTLWVGSYGSDASAGGWSINLHKRYLADANGDGKADVIGFCGAGVYVSLSNGTNAFVSPSLWINKYGNDAGAGGWSNASHVRMVGDVNGDGKADVVGCGNSAVAVSLSTGSAFSTVATQSQVNTFCTGNSPSWTVSDHPRMLADVNADGKMDLVGFGSTGVTVSQSSSNSNQALIFGTPALWIGNYGSNANAGGWNMNEHVRLMADMNNDNRADVVGYGSSGVYISYSYEDANGPGFRWPFLTMNWYCYGNDAGAFRVEHHPRMAADVNGDGADDLVAFGESGVFVTPSRNCPPCGSLPGSTLRIANNETAEQLLLPGIRLYPNPGSGNFTIEVPEQGTHHLEIFDMTGRSVLSKNMTTQREMFDISGQATGMYIVQIEKDGKTERLKIILQ